MRCLIVDDDPVCRKVLCAALRAYGSVEEATSAREAIEAVRRAMVDQRPFRLITLDVMTPDMECQTALAAIRALASEPGTKIFISTSVSDGKNIPADCREHCSGLLTKPIDLEQMFVLLKTNGLIPG
jgi:CheY-like chemotaxis protein